MTSTDDLVTRLRRTGAEPTDVEVKAAAGGLPRSVPETLSAFANGTGGTLLLGLSEAGGFAPAPGFDARSIRDAVADACVDEVHPPLRVPIEIETFEGAELVRVDVDELDPVEKPCFVTSRGDYQGSFIRGGDGDRRLTRYEVTQLLLNRVQPDFDAQAVGATVDDLDPDTVDATIRRAVQRDRRTFDGLHDTRILQLLGALTRASEGAEPTLAGLLALGRYPQQFFPQLFVSFVALPSTVMGDHVAGGPRFLDNRTIDGSVPELVAETVAAIERNMSRAAVIRGIGREDRYDYPLDVIRELVTNALMHRDYSPEARGAQVRVELYPDRLVVTSPGGLHGGLTADVLTSGENFSTSRNAVLAKLLADVPLPDRSGEAVSDNRGSGLIRVMAALRRAGMSPPEFDVSLLRVRVTVPRSALLSPETVAWISTLRLVGLDDAQHLALAMMRNAGSASSAMLQSWGVDATSAGRALRDLVGRGVAARAGGRRYATYHLAADPHAAQMALPGFGGADERHLDPVADDLDRVLMAVAAGDVTRRSIAGRLGLSDQTALRRITTLVEAGRLERVGPARSSKQTYRLVPTTEETT